MSSLDAWITSVCRVARNDANRLASYAYARSVAGSVDAATIRKYVNHGSTGRHRSSRRIGIPSGSERVRE